MNARAAVEVAEAGDDHQQDCAEDADGKITRELSDDGNAAIEKPQREQAASHRDKRAVGDEETELQSAEGPESQGDGVIGNHMGQRRPDIFRIARNAQAARSDGKRRAEDQLPDEQE